MIGSHVGSLERYAFAFARRSCLTLVIYPTAAGFRKFCHDELDTDFHSLGSFGDRVVPLDNEPQRFTY